MEHTKKFILVDPRFARPSMKDKALSGLDTDISSILESDEPDEIKVSKVRRIAETFQVLFRAKIYKTRGSTKKGCKIRAFA